MANRDLAVTLGGTVFGLKTYGDIANYWSRLVRQMDAVPNIDSHVVIPGRLDCPEYDTKWHRKSSARNEVVPTAAVRYLDVTCCDKKIRPGENQSTYIPLGKVRRLANPGKVPLEIIEVQSGNYLGGDDIVRFEDVYGRR